MVVGQLSPAISPRVAKVTMAVRKNKVPERPEPTQAPIQKSNSLTFSKRCWRCFNHSLDFFNFSTALTSDAFSIFRSMVCFWSAISCSNRYSFHSRTRWAIASAWAKKAENPSSDSDSPLEFSMGTFPQCAPIYVVLVPNKNS